MKTFYFNDLSSPAIKMMHAFMQRRGWLEASNAFLTEDALFFPDKIAKTLEYKHLLQAHVAQHGFDFMPLAYYIDDHTFSNVLSSLPRDIHKWILKPSMLNNGQDIHLFHEAIDIQKHFLNPHRMGGPQVLQAYIYRPHLLQGPTEGHKYSLRMFVVICLPYGVFLYPEGYYNISLFPYDANHKSLKGHLTNEHLLKDRRNVIQIPSSRYQALFSRCEADIYCLLETLFASFDYPETKDLKLAFFGIDLMLDADEKLWLLEANHGPCFPVDEEHPLQLSLYQGFWEALLSEILEPVAEKCKPELLTFKPLYLLGK